MIFPPAFHYFQLHHLTSLILRILVNPRRFGVVFEFFLSSVLLFQLSQLLPVISFVFYLIFLRTIQTQFLTAPNNCQTSLDLFSIASVLNPICRLLKNADRVVGPAIFILHSRWMFSNNPGVRSTSA